MDRKQAEALLEKYTQGQCTPEEKTLVERWYHDSLSAAEYPEMTRDVGEQQEETLWQIQQAGKPRYLRWLPYAAAVLLVASVVGYFAVESRKSSVDSLAATEILPGGNRAVLTLADGRTVDLSSEQEGIVIGAEDITYADGSSLGAVMVSGVEPSLQNSRDPSHAQSLPRLVGGDASVMLALTTPKGGTYQVTLPDGSKVWLNSASTLKYPSRFTGDTREVILEGEAFFAITELQGTRDTRAPAINSGSGRAPSASALDAGARVSRVPFKVQTSGQTVQVLGTQFNVSAYADEAGTKTTLVEGKVQIVNRKSNIVNQLRPGEQSIVREATTETQQVDVAQHTSWRDGIFNFTGKDLRQVMNELSRWYDIEVAYEDGVPGMTFVGRMSRQNTLGETLEILRSSKVNYRLEGRKLIITNALN